MLGVQEKHTLTEPWKPRRALSSEKGAQVAGTQPHRRENMPMGRPTFYSLKTMPLSKQNSTMLVGMKTDTATRANEHCLMFILTMISQEGGNWSTVNEKMELCKVECLM